MSSPEPYRTPAQRSEAKETSARCARCGVHTGRFSMFASSDGDICEACFGRWRATVSLRATDLRNMRAYTWQFVWGAVSAIWFFVMLAIPAAHDDGKEHVGSNLFFVGGTAFLAWRLWRLSRGR